MWDQFLKQVDQYRVKSDDSKPDTPRQAAAAAAAADAKR